MIIIFTEDKNDNPPRFTRLFRVNITENSPIGSFVIQVTSIDKDKGKDNSNVTYDLLTKTEMFEIDRQTGNVYVAAELDREQRNEYVLTVGADDGSWKAQTRLTIYILDENDVTPRFEQSNYQFDAFVPMTSNNSYNLTVGQVQAIDLDEGTNGLISYRFKSRSKYFAIDSHSGQISLKKWPKIYSEMNFLNQHFLVVIATDKSLLLRSSEVSVLVRCFSSTKNESNQTFGTNGASLDTISLTIPVDLSNQTLLYTSKSMIYLLENAQGIVQSKYNQLFFIGQSRLQANKSYMVKVDNTYTQLNINLLVTQANSHTPVFLYEHNSTTILENSFIYTNVFNASAVDRDQSSANNVIRYSFNLTALHWNVNSSSYLLANYRDKYPHLFKRNLTVPEIVSNIEKLSPLLNPFSINHSTGELHLSHSLDFELITRYSLLISATDNAWYARTASLNFDVFVSDIDDFVDHRKCQLLQ